LDNVKKQLSKKENEIGKLSELASSSKKEVELKLGKIKELESQLNESEYQHK